MGLIESVILPPSQVESELTRLVSGVQTELGAPRGLGKAVYPTLSTDLLRTDTGVLWSFGGMNNAEVSYTLVGNMMFLNFNIGQGIYSVLAGAANYLMLRIPDNYQAVQRTSGDMIPKTVPCFVVDLGVPSAGFGVAQVYSTHVRIIPVAFAAFVGPSIHVAGQVNFEVVAT